MNVSILSDITTLVNLLPTAALSVTTNGTGVDITQYQGKFAIILDSGAGAGGTTTLDVKIQDSADGSTGWADVSGATFTQVTTVASRQKIGVLSDICKQYIRAVATIGAGATFSFSVNALGVKAG